MKEESRSEHNPIHVSGDGAALKAERLAPLEERVRQLSGQKQNDAGVINVPDTGSLKLPSQLTEKDEEKASLFGLEPITIFIMAFALAFIAFVTYLIATEPPKDKDEPAPVTIERQP